MPETVQSFSTLLTLARQGDQHALAQLTQQYESKVRLVARVVLGPALRPYLDTVDLVQSVHRSLLLGLRAQKVDIAGPDNLIALTVLMVRRKVARRWAHLRRQQRLSGAPAGRDDLPGLLLGVSSPQADPAREAAYRDMVRQLCRQLSEAERRMLALRLQGHTTAEVAAALGVSPIALRVRLTRLRQRLQDGGVFADWL